MLNTQQQSTILDVIAPQEMYRLPKGGVTKTIRENLGQCPKEAFLNTPCGN